MEIPEPMSENQVNQMIDDFCKKNTVSGTFMGSVRANHGLDTGCDEEQMKPQDGCSVSRADWFLKK